MTLYQGFVDIVEGMLLSYACIITASVQIFWPCVLDWWHVTLRWLVTLHWQSQEIRLGNIYKQVFTVQKGLGTNVPTWVRDGQAWLSLRDSLLTLARPCHLTLDLALGSPHLGSWPLGQTPQCACHWVDGNPGPFLILPLCQMTLIPHHLDMEGTTSTADPGSYCSPFVVSHLTAEGHPMWNWQ